MNWNETEANPDRINSDYTKIRNPYLMAWYVATFQLLKPRVFNFFLFGWIERQYEKLQIIICFVYSLQFSGYFNKNSLERSNWTIVIDL